VPGYSHKDTYMKIRLALILIIVILLSTACQEPIKAQCHQLIHEGVIKYYFPADNIFSPSDDIVGFEDGSCYQAWVIYCINDEYDKKGNREFRSSMIGKSYKLFLCQGRGDKGKMLLVPSSIPWNTQSDKNCECKSF
jgi:hypothetical protein